MIDLTAEEFDVVSEFFRQLFLSSHKNVVIAGDPGWRYYKLREEDKKVVVSKQDEDENRPGFLKNNEDIGTMSIDDALKDYLKTYNEFSKLDYCLAFVYDGKVHSYEEFLTRK